MSATNDNRRVPLKQTLRCKRCKKRERRVGIGDWAFTFPNGTLCGDCYEGLQEIRNRHSECMRIEINVYLRKGTP